MVYPRDKDKKFELEKYNKRLFDSGLIVEQNKFASSSSERLLGLALLPLRTRRVERGHARELERHLLLRLDEGQGCRRLEVPRDEGRGGGLVPVATSRRVDLHFFGGDALPPTMIGSVLQQVDKPRVVTALTSGAGVFLRTRRRMFNRK